MAICKDPNDQTQKNAAAIAPLPSAVASDGTLLPSFAAIAFDGTLLPSFAAIAFDDYSSLVSADIGLNSGNNTLINKYVRQYGRDAFDAGLVAINNTLINKEAFQNNLPNYPQLETRLSTQLPITPIEYANYMSEFLQNPNTVVGFVNSNTPLIQSQLNDFYRNNFTQSAMGSFCALMPDIFGAIGGFFNLVENAQQVFQDITDFINSASLKDFSLKVIMKKLIDQIKTQILKVVDDMVSKVKGIIENISFENVIGQIETFVNNRIISQFISIKAKALSFFSEENIKNLKKKIENLFNYAAGVFKDPSLEEIQFLVYRFCAFAGQIENAINLVKKPLDDFVGNYQNNFNTIKSQGRVVTSAAVVNGGAIRISDEDRTNRINNGIEIEQQQQIAPPAGITNEEWKDVESLSTFEALRADSRFYIPVGNISWALKPIGQDLEDGWEMIYHKGNKELVARLVRLQKLFKKRLTILSAYRNEKMQAEVNPGVTGYHIHAKALDIQWEGLTVDSREKFIYEAVNKCGFRGIGRYSWGVHIDIGHARKPWGIAPPVGWTYVSDNSSAEATEVSTTAEVSTTESPQELLYVKPDGTVTNPEADPEFARASPINEAVPLSPERARTRLGNQRLTEGRQYVIEGKVYTAQRLGLEGLVYQSDAPIRLVDDRGIPASF